MGISLSTKKCLAAMAAFFCCAVILLPHVAQALAATTAVTIVSTSPVGGEADGASNDAGVSADGRYVVFNSGATNLVPNDTNATTDVFVKDVQTGAIVRASTDSAGNESNGSCVNVSISANGRYVACRATTTATNFVLGDTNGVEDIIIKDLQTGITVRASTDSAGNESNGGSLNPALSADGRYVSFHSTATNLVPNDTNGSTDVFVKDLQTGSIERVSTDSSGNQSSTGNSTTNLRAISADGRYIIFYSGSSTLVANDTNGVTDVFIKDRQTNTTTRVTTNSAGVEQNNSTPMTYAISGNGRYVVFHSNATNLVSGDSNAAADLFMKDTFTGATTRLSTNSAGQQGTGGSVSVIGPGVSYDGRYVSFTSTMTNLVANDTNGVADHFVKDTLTGELARVTTTATGVEANGTSSTSSTTDISDYGHYVVFRSDATNLASNDTNAVGDVFYRANPLATLLADDDFDSTPLIGQGVTESVLINDTRNGVSLDRDDYILSIADNGGLNGISIAGDGVLTIPAGASTGTYNVTYRTCEAAMPDYCETARVTVSVLGASTNLVETGIKATLILLLSAGALVLLAFLTSFKRKKKYVYERY